MRHGARHVTHAGSRDVTHCELFASLKALVIAAGDLFARYSRQPQRVLPIIGAQPAIVA